MNSLHPGAISTSLGQQNGGLLGKVLPVLLKPFFRSPEKGAETSIFLCVSPEVENISGEYFYNCRPHSCKPWARDAAAARQLWEISERDTQFSYA